MKKINFTLFFLIALLGCINAQNGLYFTRNASLNILGEYNGKNFKGSTQKLSVTLDYESTEIILGLELSDLEFDADLLNELIQPYNTKVEFKGLLGLDYINTDGHPIQYFDIEGELKINGKKNRIHGEGELHHIEQHGILACMLGITMSLDLNDFDIEVPELEDKIRVVIKHALLDKDKH